MNGAPMMRHHSVWAGVGVGEEIGNLVDSNIYFANWGGVVNACQGSSVALRYIHTFFHQPRIMRALQLI